jgi:cobalt-zinc-cadmium efflux system outer membrane protein
MKRIAVLTMLIGGLWTTGAFAGYDDLRRAIEDYGPPRAVYPAVPPAAVAAAAPEPSEFDAVRKQLEALGEQWRQSLQTPAADESFYLPAARQGEAVAQLSADPDAVLGRLAGEFSLESLESLVWWRSPAVKAAEKQFLASVEAFSQVANLDAILLQYTVFTRSLKTGVGPMKGRDPVEKKFPFPGLLDLKGQIVDQQVRAAREDLEIARRDALTAARQVYWRLGYVHEAQRVTERMLGLLDRLESVATTRYESGRTSYQDVAKVRIEKQTLAQRLVTLRERQRNLESKILGLLDLPPLSRIGRPKSRALPRVPYELADLYELALRRRQEIRRLKADIGRVARMEEMIETQIMPGFSLNLSVYEDNPISKAGSGSKTSSFPVSTQASMGAGLPKSPWYGSDDAYLRQVELKYRALQAQLQGVEADTRYQVRNAWFELDKAERELRLYKNTVISLSEAALEAANSGYEAGNVIFADVFNAYIIWLQARLELADRTSATGIAKAGLERVVGVTLR